MLQIKPEKHGGNIYSVMRKSGKTVNQLLDYSANINPLGLSDSVRQAILQSVEKVIHYPDAEATALKEAVSAFYDVPVAAITAGNGAVEMLYVLCHSIRPKKVLITAPAFSEYEQAARASGAVVQYHYLSEDDNFSIDTETMLRNLSGVDMVFIGNPNNPTGTLLLREQIERLLSAALAKQIYVVVDESFLDFLPDDSQITCRPLLADCPNLVIIHSLTKFYAIPGLRLGFALANPELTRQLHNSKDPWNVNTLAQHAGVAALQDADYRQQSRDLVGVAKQELYRELLGINGMKPYLPAVNFILVNIKESGFSARELRQQMLEQDILIRDCSNYPGLSAEYIRLAVKCPEHNRILLNTMRQVLGET